MKTLSALFALFALFVFSLYGLPPFRSLFASKYGFKASCALCHRPDELELNSYGRGFLKNGLNLAAFGTLEKIDVDKDGFFGLEEIQAKSNPGDGMSTPEKVGAWMKEIVPLKAPVKVLKKVFPEAVSFETIERPLSEEELDRISRSTPTLSLSDADKFAVVFVVKEARGITGGAAYVGVSEDSPKGPRLHTFLLSSNPNGKILDLTPVHVHRKDFKRVSFLKQFRGLWPEDAGKISFPKTTPKKLAEHFRLQIAKYARQIDVVIAP